MMQRFFSPSKRTIRTRRRRSSSNVSRPSIRLLLERLEDRNLLSIFTVTNTLDNGNPGSLRWAINQANADADPVSNINFYIPGSGLQTIAPTSALPTITHPVVIDGYTQPGSSLNTLGIGPGSPGHQNGDGDNAILKIQLDGENAGPVIALRIIANGTSTVRGLVINRFQGAAIANGVGNAESDIITGNFIGTDVTGTMALPNNTAGFGVVGHAIGAISIFCSGNEIGGLSPADRNLISGNTVNGIYIYPSEENNQIQGNLIGLDATGIAPLGNGSQGIEAYGLGTIVGGTSGAARNVVSANGGTFFDDSGVYGAGILVNNDYSIVQGNFVGTDVTGTLKLSNASSGIAVNSGSHITIGGTPAGAGNVTSSIVALGTGSGRCPADS